MCGNKRGRAALRVGQSCMVQAHGGCSYLLQGLACTGCLAGHHPCHIVLRQQLPSTPSHLDACHDGGGSGTPLHLNKWRHVAASAMLTLQHTAQYGREQQTWMQECAFIMTSRDEREINLADMSAPRT